jgi:transposase
MALREFVWDCAKGSGGGAVWMEINDIRDFYAQSLGVKTPWHVTEVRILGDRKRIEVRVACREGTVWTDPETRQQAHVHGWRERSWRHLDTCEFETVVIASLPRLKLPSGRTMSVSVPWAEPGGRFTRRMEGHLVDVLLCCPALTDAARIAGITVDMADGVLERAVDRGLARRKEAAIPSLGIDEPKHSGDGQPKAARRASAARQKAIRKHHRYATILTDIEGGRVHEVAEGRTTEVAAGLLRDLPEAVRKGVEAVAMDMWPAYIRAVTEQLPEASIVFDRFHVSKHLNEAVDKVRRGEHRELSAAGNLLLKGTKYQWLKTHLDMRLKSAVEFRGLLVHDLQTGTAWSLKEMFRHFWSYRSLSWAMRSFDRWLESVRASGLKSMERLAAMLADRASGLFNNLFFPITNSAVEGLNAMIQHLRVAARGLPRFETFRARILFHLGKLDLHPA